jgi:hypothetical protein
MVTVKGALCWVKSEDQETVPLPTQNVSAVAYC